MERQDVKDTILKNLRLNVDGLDGSEIDTSKSMIDYGATSLDIVEIVSASMRKLKINVPRTELANLRNMDQLIDLLVTKAEAPR